MWALFDQYYSGNHRARFEADFRAKDTVFLIWDNECLVGFNSIKIVTVDGQRVMYSGDMLIDTSARGLQSACIFRAWANALWQQCDWWCALTSGPRTYRIPFVMFNRVTPNPANDETAKEAALRHRFASSEYGRAYDFKLGVARLDHPYVLRAEHAEVRATYPLDAFFRQRNPGWSSGDELVSLIALHPNNWSARARRLLGTVRT